MLHNLSAAREVCDATEADHYEILDKYITSQAYEYIEMPPPRSELANVQLQQPLSSTGDYDYTQCPAYISVATTSIHSNPGTLTAANPATAEGHNKIGK